ncbi:MAG: conserved exported protein of unknown function [Methanothrix sp.]|jgi:uncharacterized GH25 family protein|nr:MAG: conserved exported protein of unknown function [Methanothrix sp.]
MNRILALCLLLAFAVAGGEAHDTWLMTTSGWASEGDLALVQMTEGHYFVPMAPPPGDISIRMTGPEGYDEEYDLDETAETNGPYYRVDFDVPLSGLYVATGEQHEGPLTFVRTRFAAPSEEMDGYDEIAWDEVDTAGWDSDWYIAEAYDDLVKFSKLFIVAENADFASASVPVGQRLEIIPLDNITSLGTGEFRFLVLFDGEPAAGLDVRLAMTGNPAVEEGVTDKDGVVVLAVPEPGLWIAATEHKDGEMMVLPQRGPDAVDESFVGTGYFSVLTLRPDYIKPEAD